MNRWVILVLVTTVLWGALRAQDAPKPVVLARGSTVIVLRHAEKDPAGDARDPELSEKGRARAQALVRLLERAQPEHFYASEFKRAQLTLAPLAEKLGHKVEPVPAKDPGEVVKRLRALPPGSVSVVAGHSNTVPGLIQALGGTVERLQKGQLGENEFDRVFVVSLPPAELEGKLAPGVVELAYGD